MNVKVGDIIILRSESLTDFYFSWHIGVKQKVVRLSDDGWVFTEFMDYNGKSYGFNFNKSSTYALYCEVVPKLLSRELKKYSFI